VWTSSGSLLWEQQGQIKEVQISNVGITTWKKIPKSLNKHPQCHQPCSVIFRRRCSILVWQGSEHLRTNRSMVQSRGKLSASASLQGCCRDHVPLTDLCSVVLGK
jgi:hypothetical protein